MLVMLSKVFGIEMYLQINKYHNNMQQTYSVTKNMTNLLNSTYKLFVFRNEQIYVKSMTQYKKQIQAQHL